MFGVGTIYMILSLLLMVISLISRDLMPGGMDYLFFVLIAALSIKTMIGNREFSYPKFYIGTLILLLAVILFNSFTSKYSPGFMFIMIATVVTILPFLSFLLSYNIRLTSTEINSFIDRIITLACILSAFVYVETLLFDPEMLDNIISSDVIMIGFLASFCSQSVVLSLARFHVTGRKRYLYAIAFLFLTVLLLNQLKATAGAAIAIVAYLFFMSRMSKVLKIIVLSCVAAVFAVWMSVSGSLMIEKATKYTEYITDEEAGEGIARVAVYVQSVEMAKDHFPLGTGQGTFGSIPVNFIYSDVYYDYNLSDVWGLEKDGDVDFKMDTHWASILGEMGVLGFIIYVFLMLYPMIAVRRLASGGREVSRVERSYIFAVSCGLTILMIESFVLVLPNRLCFIMIYAALNAIIVRNMYSSENLLEYEDSADND